MNCTHHLFKCVNNVYYCTLCGARLETVEVKTVMGEKRDVVIGVEKKTEAEAPKKRRTVKKKGEE